MGETTRKSSEEIPESHEVLCFSDELKELRKLLGKKYEELEHDMDDNDLDTMERELGKNHAFDSFSDAFRNNGLIMRRRSLRYEAALERGEKLSPLQQNELVIANQSATYHEYFPLVLHNVLNQMTTYERMRGTALITVPLELLKQEKHTEEFLKQLNEALKERLHFSNAILARSHLDIDGVNKKDVINKLKQTLSELDAMETRETHAILEQGTSEQKRMHGNKLNQQIIDLLAGEENDTLPNGFLPNNVVIDLLAIQYQGILDKQIALARNQDVSDLQEEYDILYQRNTDAEKRRDAPLSEKDGKRFIELQSLLNKYIDDYDAIVSVRKDITQQMIERMNELRKYHLQMEEIVAIQNQFGGMYDLEGAKQINPAVTPEKLAKSIAKNMEERRQFHIRRLQEFNNRFEEEVLNVDWKVHIENMWNEGGGRDFIREVSNMLANAITAPLPETAGVRMWAKKKLAGPLNEAMGWPAEKMNLSFEELTHEERMTVLEKAKSVLTIINEVDRLKIYNAQETMAAVQALPPPGTFAGEVPQDPLPKDRITQKNTNELIKKYNGATVTFMLLGQLDSDWGNTDPPKGCIGEYSKFFEKIDRNIGVHVDVAKALFEMKDIYNNMRDALLLMAAAALLASGVGGKLFWKGIKHGKKLLRRRPAPPRAPTTPRPLPKFPRASGHLIRFAGEALIGLEIWRRNNIELNMEPLPAQEGVGIALTIMRHHPHVNRDADRYFQEVHSLEQRRDLLEMQSVMEHVLDTLRTVYRDNLQEKESKQMRQLIERGMELKGKIKKLDHTLYKFFPITDLIKKSAADNPKDKNGMDGPEILRVEFDELRNDWKWLGWGSLDVDNPRKRGIDFYESSIKSPPLNILKRRYALPERPSEKELRKQLGKEGFTELREALLDHKQEIFEPKEYGVYDKEFDDISKKYYAFVMGVWAEGLVK